MIEPEKLTQEQIAIWLKERHGGDRTWLAEQMGISAGAVAHCFSKRGFSNHGKACVARLMQLDDAVAGGSPNVLGEIQLTMDEWDRMEQARFHQGNHPRPQFIRESIVWYTDKVLEEKAWADLGKSDAFADDGLDRAAESPPETLGGPGEG